MSTFQQEEFEHPQQPQKKTTKTKQGKIPSKPSRVLFEENTSTELADQRTSELLPSPSQIDPEFLAALPDDVRQEIEQAYKRKDCCVGRARSQAPLSVASDVVGFPPEKSTGRSAEAGHSDDVQKKEVIDVNTAPKRVSFKTRSGTAARTGLSLVVRDIHFVDIVTFFTHCFREFSFKVNEVPAELQLPDIIQVLLAMKITS